MLFSDRNLRLRGRSAIVYYILRGLDLLKVGLPMAIFFFRFLEWWYSTHRARAPATSDKLPPPPDCAPIKVASFDLALFNLLSDLILSIRHSQNTSIESNRTQIAHFACRRERMTQRCYHPGSFSANTALYRGFRSTLVVL